MFLKLRNIYAGYDGSDVLKGIDLAVEQGTTTCIVGPNGAGKSTVLRVLSGLLRPRLGEITFDG
ncbi:MAG: ATP-binding cassette domain-containing protein, partial [Ktedonobacteraceae bacterium]